MTHTSHWLAPVANEFWSRCLTVPVRGVATVYALIGDSFAYLCLLGLVVLVAMALLRQRALARLDTVPGPSPI